MVPHKFRTGTAFGKLHSPGDRKQPAHGALRQRQRYLPDFAGRRNHLESCRGREVGRWQSPPPGCRSSNDHRIGTIAGAAEADLLQPFRRMGGSVVSHDRGAGIGEYAFKSAGVFPQA